MARYVFRALNQEDIDNRNASDEKQSIFAKAPGDTRYSLFNFIMSGSRLRTRFIAMTDRVSIADIKYGSLNPTEATKRDSVVVLIDLDKLNPNLIHDGPAAECFKVNGSINNSAINATEADNEVIYENEIKPDCYHEIPPLLLDIMTAYEITNIKDTHKDKICDLIVKGKSEELMTKLFSNVELNPIEKFFVEKYYGLNFDDNGNVKINKEKNQPLKGDMIAVEEALKKEFNIIANNYELPKALLARCIHTKIIKSLNYKEAEISPLTYYNSPIREKTRAKNMSKGRYHINYKEPPQDEQTGKRIIGIRRLGSNLYYADNDFGSIDGAINIPQGISYDTTTEGYIALHAYYSTLSYDEISGEYVDSTDLHFGNRHNETVYMASMQKIKESGLQTKNAITSKEILRQALGDLALTKSECDSKRLQEKKARKEEETRTKEANAILASQAKGELPPDRLAAELRRNLGEPNAKFLKYGKKTKLALQKDQAYEDFMNKTVFGKPLTFTTSKNKPVQSIEIQQIPTRKVTKQVGENQITYYKVADGSMDFIDLPSQYFYSVKITDLADKHQCKTTIYIKDEDSLKKFLEAITEQKVQQI